MVKGPIQGKDYNSKRLVLAVKLCKQKKRKKKKKGVWPNTRRTGIKQKKKKKKYILSIKKKQII